MKALLATLILWGASSSADIINCDFTEPFFSTSYSMVQQSLTVIDIEANKKVIKGVSFQIMGAGHFELWDKDKNVLQTIFLNYNGSNGMSDMLYPYEVINSNLVYDTGSNIVVEIGRAHV